MTKYNNIVIVLLYFVVMLFVINISDSTEYPTPPPVPNKFSNAQEVQRYLNQLHNYYMVVGRPR
jgi:hypothetical protein